MLRGAARELAGSQLRQEQQARFVQAQSALTPPAPASSFVVIGDVLQVGSEDGYLRGHGTQILDDQLVATVCGFVERVNKLIFVRPFRARYDAKVGDVVVGRVTEITGKRWKVKIHGKHHAHLMLSAVNLPGGIQRRRTAVDELNMRSVFVESDLISAEVQSVNADGSVHLHTRSLKYGKLRAGQLVEVPPYLMKRLPQHFHQFGNYGVEVIFGCNGNVWVSPIADVNAKEAEQISISMETREKICRVANAVRVLSAIGFLIYPDPLVAIYEESLKSGIQLKDMLSSAFLLRITEMEALNRINNKSLKKV